RIPTLSFRGDVSQQRSAIPSTLCGSFADVCLRFSLVASSAIFDHAAKPLGKLLVRRDLAGRSAQIQMRMCIRQSRQNRGVAQVIISRVCAVWFDGGDAVVGDGDDAALQRRGIDGENPAGGE